MNIATDTTIDTRRWVCVRWDLFGGYYYVGPFAEAHEAADWATENEGTDISWQTEHLDPNIALEVCAPGKLPSWSRTRTNRTAGPSGRATSVTSIC